MKFALFVVALVVPKIVPIGSLSEIRQNIVLDVVANDHIWAEYLNVAIKYESEKLTDAGKKVLMDLNVLTPESRVENTLGQEPNPDEEKKRDQENAQNKLLVAKALDIVVEVASHYHNHGMALKFALDAIASAIKCKTLMYILVQLHAIKKTQNLQPTAITAQRFDIWNTLLNILNKVAVLKKSFEEEFELYQLWEVFNSDDKVKELKENFNIFHNVVENKLDESCELSSFEQIKKFMQLNTQLGIQLDDEKNWESVEDTTNIFIQSQNILKRMFKDISISSTNIENWEHVLNKSGFKEPTTPPT